MSNINPMEMANEFEWRGIPGTGGRYAASINGEILNRITDRVLSLVLQKSGYTNVRVHNTIKPILARVHRLIATTFLPLVKGKTQVNHINGIKNDNRLQNLEWCNASENQRHALSTGLKVPLSGENCGSSKLKSHQVQEIRLRFNAGGISQRGLAKEYGISQSAVSLLISGKRWNG